MLKELLQKIADRKGLFPEDLESFLDDFIPNALMKEETLQKAFSITEREMEELYKTAYEYYDKEEYPLALEHFRFLVILNPYPLHYWMGYAACLQLLQEYDRALHGYAVAALLDKEDPLPHYHAYECYLGVDNDEEARKALRAAYELACKDNRYTSLQKKIKTLEDKLLVH